MKKLLFILMLILFIACKNEPPFAGISGAILNFEGETIVLSGLNFSDTINVQEGKFDKLIDLPYDGLYTLKFNDKHQKYVYLEKDFSISLTMDINDFENSLAFSGTNVEENNFMLKKHTTLQEVYGNFNDPESLKNRFSLQEGEFIALNENYKTKILKTLKEQQLKNKKFVELETMDATFHIYKELSNYPRYHSYFSGNEYFKVSESFPKIPNDFDYNNEDYFYFSNSYRNLTSMHFYDELYSDVENAEDILAKAFQMLEDIKSPLIRSEILPGLQFFLNASSTNLEGDYKKMLDYSLNSTFKKELAEKYELLKNLVKGKPSPTFTFENIEGEITSLEDLKGKYLYIDVWATWCGPCIAEIPALKELEKAYHNKNIEFVSISIDEYKDKDKWKKMIEAKELKGVQLIADKDWSSDFVKQYAIDGIPRFILLDDEGNIISSDAPRPSDSKLKEVFDELAL